MAPGGQRRQAVRQDRASLADRYGPFWGLVAWVGGWAERGLGVADRWAMVGGRSGLRASPGSIVVVTSSGVEVPFLVSQRFYQR